MNQSFTIRCILFDCISTLIDHRELPSTEQYAHWAYEGSGCEEFWHNIDQFVDLYLQAGSEVPRVLAEHQEYEFRERLRFICRSSLLTLEERKRDEVVEKLYCTYWQNYSANCYAREDVVHALPIFKDQFLLGVVSNFMVEGGIEELLRINNIDQFFEFVVTSIGAGWKKPHRRIYEAAINLAGMSPGEILFVGDDLECDFVGPKSVGVKSLLLDRNNDSHSVDDKVRSFAELLTYLNCD